jgi:sugar transferase EpsL
MSKSLYMRLGKRVFDLVVVVPLLLALAPVMLIIAATTRLLMGGPFLFRQARTGRAGKSFTIYKFRTMTNVMGESLSDDQRLTPLGIIFRRTRIDELPQLLNILRGEMSLVGPRPLLPEYLSHYTPREARRHEALPGLTGWAQVNGGNQLSWEKKLEYDVWYVDHITFWLDLRILWRTFLLLIEFLMHPRSDEVVSCFEDRRSDRHL